MSAGDPSEDLPSTPDATGHDVDRTPAEVEASVRAGGGRPRAAMPREVGSRLGADNSPGDVGPGRGDHGRTRSSPTREDASADPDSVARSICLRLLTGAPKTRAQLADALRRKNVPDDVAERVLDRLGEVGLVDDAAFAEAWVHTRHTGRGLARRALRSELRRRGVDDDTASDAVEALDDDTELATARALVERKLPATRQLQPTARFRRLAGMLARKGYPAGLVTRVVREALEADHADVESLPDLDEGGSDG